MVYPSPSLQNRVTVPSLAHCSLPLLSSSILVLHRASLCPPCRSISLSVPSPRHSLARSFSPSRASLRAPPSAGAAGAAGEDRPREKSYFTLCLVRILSVPPATVIRDTRVGRVHDQARTHESGQRDTVQRFSSERVLRGVTHCQSFLSISFSVLFSLRLFFDFPRAGISLHDSSATMLAGSFTGRTVARCNAGEVCTRSRACALVRENHRSYTPRTRLRTSFDCPGWGARLDVASREQHRSACFSLLFSTLVPSLFPRHVLPPLLRHPYYLYQKFQPLRAGTHARGPAER